MNNEEFREWGHRFVDWMSDYYQNIEDYPVKSLVKPGEIFRSLPTTPPGEGEDMSIIFNDFLEKIIPGITHWQSPDFFAYFPANGSYPSILAEMLTATLGVQGMIWETSPAAAELEELVMEWLKQMTGLPGLWSGAIQDTASTSTLTAILTAREKVLDFESNRRGLRDMPRLRVYCSSETHSSVDKAVKIAGIGKENLVKIRVDNEFRMDPKELEKAIVQDIANGYKPLCVVATVGTTGCTAVDPLKEIAAACKDKGLWMHIDGAYGGTALLLPEMRWMIDGIEDADSMVLNPHKWMFTNFDCSAYFVKDKESLIRTFEILPEYLKTGTRGLVNDYRDWGIQLGRRFRALKLWFVIRNFGVEGLQLKIREHIRIARWLEERIISHPDFEILAPRHFSLLCFRLHPQSIDNQDELNTLNEELLKSLNLTGKLYMTHTKLNGSYTLRMSISQTSVTQQHVEKAWEMIQHFGKDLIHKK